MRTQSDYDENVGKHGIVLGNKHDLLLNTHLCWSTPAVSLDIHLTESKCLLAIDGL